MGFLIGFLISFLIKSLQGWVRVQVQEPRGPKHSFSLKSDRDDLMNGLLLFKILFTQETKIKSWNKAYKVNIYVVEI